jgi:uncharacterized protein with HEPN domain
MIAYAQKAVAFLGAGGAPELEADEQKLFAILRAIEIVGEAASKVSKTLKTAEPGLPWAAASQMRNLLIHAYPEIDIQIVVSTVREDFPPMIAALKQLLGEGPIR